MILIADSGSTKTAWILTDGRESRSFTTSGLNPYHISSDEIRETLARELLPRTGVDISGIYFYGAGCTPAKIPELTGIFAKFFPSARIEVASDLLGACRGLCGRDSGIVCILGTGSNSCEYDGEKIVANTPPLGYILGDEGSGAALGKAFVSDCLKGHLPEDLKDELLAAHGLVYADIIENVYRRPMANRFLAGFAPFIAEHRHIPKVRSLVIKAFREFLWRNVLQYNTSDKSVNFTGSIAIHFSDLLAEAVEEEGLTMGTTTQTPIGGLASYHMKA